jgi:glycosyltransferase involved in cell wall biosynthesis
LSHRLPLALAARNEGYDVHIATPDWPDSDAIRRLGFTFHAVPVYRKSLAPWNELRTIGALARLYRKVGPLLVHHVSLKVNLYGTIAARLTGVPAVVNAVPGLGYLFIGEGIGKRMLRKLFILTGRSVFSRPTMRFIFQNHEDLNVFTKARIARPQDCRLIRGSGVDVKEFRPMPEPAGGPVAALASRMLWTKGVGDFVEAARLLKQRHARWRFVLVGSPDPGNPDSVSRSQLEEWNAAGLVEWWGFRQNMPEVFSQCSVVVLPTWYREGVPKVLIEAASSGRAIVTTDMPGCTDIVRHEENGLIVPTRNTRALADALSRLLSDTTLRDTMGRRGRQLVESDFAIERVVEDTLNIYRELECQLGSRTS